MHDTPIYQPKVFDVEDETDAKKIILTPEIGTTTETRWETETAFLVKDIGSFFHPEEDSLILDFGCGIGRLSKKLITEYHCNVLGFDISKSMRVLSLKYVDSDKFGSVSKPIVIELVKNDFRVDMCIAVWVLQHCPNVEEDILFIKYALRKNGLFYVVNNLTPAIPTDKGWMNDGTDIKSLLNKHFKILDYYRIPKEHTSEHLSQQTFIARLQNS